jgi:hypothetical protein
MLRFGSLDSAIGRLTFRRRRYLTPVLDLGFLTLALAERRDCRFWGGRLRLRCARFMDPDLIDLCEFVRDAKLYFASRLQLRPLGHMR